MPWYLHDGSGSKVSMQSLAFEGGKQIWARLEEYRFPHGGRDLERFQQDRWQHQTIRFKRQRKSPVHCLPAGDGSFISESARCVIERLEPGVHHPIRVKLLAHDRTPWHEPFWYYQHRHLPRVDAIDIAASRVRLMPEPMPKDNIFESPVLFTGTACMQTYLDARKIAGHHFFGQNQTGYRWFFFSDELAEALKAANAFHGFDLEIVGLTHGDEVGSLVR